jgi:3-phenylpropionate/trans-cinnamate dioxygenase ferredoxin reductase subunit
VAERRAGVLIVGAGPAGSACAETLRAEGYDGSILLAGREPDPPYDRPPLSKGYLTGRATRASLHLYADDFWEQQDVELLTRASVMKLDPVDGVATLATKDEVRFEKALVSTGANVRRLRVDGANLEGIHYLRTPANADAIRADAEAAAHVVLIGGSFIACEVAASLTSLGKRCSLIMLEAVPLQGVFGDAAGGYFDRLLREHGIEIHGGETLVRFEGAERVERVVCESGLTLDAGTVVMGTGAVPDVMLARSAGLDIGESGGVACDATLRTSAERVWAAGDMCEYDSVVHGRRLRVEHWEVARAQGRHAARAMLGSSEPYAEIPYFWSDLADWASLEAVGPAAAWDREIVRGSVDEGAFTIFYVGGDRVVAALSVGRSADLDLARELLASGAPVDEAALAG